MVSCGLERVFEIGHAYRAEKHETPRHLNEYVSLDVEMAFIESEQELMDLEVRILTSIFKGISGENRRELEAWGAAVPEPERVAAIPRISYDEAREIISRQGGKKVYEINPDDFMPSKHRAIGGLQIVPGDVAREFGYCKDTKWQSPVTNETWQDTRGDRAFRGILGTKGLPIHLPNLYRIRQTTEGEVDTIVV